MSSPLKLDGYVADTLYPSRLHAACLPGWTDAFLLAAGFAPPRRAGRAPFTLIDLGCGDGFGLTCMAAAHPEGRFIGYDLLDGHVAAGNARIAALGLGNVEIRQGSFGTIAPDCAADYVTAHGVLAWVGHEAQAALIALAARLLKPGGVFSVSYNAMPAWQPRIAFQRLVNRLAEAESGDSNRRFMAAFERVRASGAIEAPVIDFVQGLIDRVGGNYLEHEFLNDYWNPLWSADVIARVEQAGLAWAGQAAATGLYPRFVLRAAQRAALAAMPERLAREIAFDCFVGSAFRTEMFVRPPLAAPAPEEIARRRLASHWLATVPEATADYQCDGPAGTLRFNNEAAHAIFRHLEAGPGTLEALAEIGEANLVNTLDVLFLSGQVQPAEPAAAVPVAARLNAHVRAGRSGNGLAGRNGAMKLDERAFLQLDAAGLRRFGLDGLVEPAPPP